MPDLLDQQKQIDLIKCAHTHTHTPVVGAGVVVVAGVVRHELLDALLDLSEARLCLFEALLEEAPEVGRLRHRRGQGRHRVHGGADLPRGKRLRALSHIRFTHHTLQPIGIHALQIPGLAQRYKYKDENINTHD